MLERDQWARTKYVIFNLTHRNRYFLLLLFFFNFDFQKYPALTLEVAGDLRRAPVTFENRALTFHGLQCIDKTKKVTLQFQSHLVSFVTILFLCTLQKIEKISLCNKLPSLLRPPRKSKGL